MKMLDEALAATLAVRKVHENKQDARFLSANGRPRADPIDLRPPGQ